MTVTTYQDSTDCSGSNITSIEVYNDGDSEDFFTYTVKCDSTSSGCALVMQASGQHLHMLLLTVMLLVLIHM